MIVENPIRFLLCVVVSFDLPYLFFDRHGKQEHPDPGKRVRVSSSNNKL